MMSDEMVREYLRKDEPASKALMLVNPFTKLAGWTALWAGLLVVAATVGVALSGRVLFDGIMDVHAGIPVPAWARAAMPVIDWLVVALLFLVAGLIWGAKPQRFVDYFGMSALGRLPFLLVGLLWTEAALGRYLPGLVKLMPTSAGTPPDLAAVPGLPWIVAGGIITMLLMVWGLFLNFFALREASGMKMPRAVWVYVGVIFVGEIVSKVLMILPVPLYEAAKVVMFKGP